MRRAARRARTGGAAESAPAERLQKVLARSGLASRREAEAWIRAGRLTVNGVPATLGARVAPTDQVRLDGRLVRTRAGAAPGVFLCHRSPGELLAAPGTGAAPENRSGTRGEAEPAMRQTPPVVRPALLERLPRRAGRRFVTVSPMPRIDGGLELVTSDGELAEKLQRGVHALASEFSVRVRGELTEPQVRGITDGVLDSGAQVAVERLAVAGGEGANRWYTLAARGASGKEVRQLFERQGAHVSRVLRTRLGPLTLERSLARGQFRELSEEELRALVAGEPQR
jgi:23S rRNA pseudouridine2605 synthase